MYSLIWKKEGGREGEAEKRGEGEAEGERTEFHFWEHVIYVGYNGRDMQPNQWYVLLCWFELKMSILKKIDHESQICNLKVYKMYVSLWMTFCMCYKIM